jgi:DNA anti-recombination protein RmuC
MSEVDISELFEVPDELKDKIKQKKPKVKKELSEDKKEELRERLKKARAVAKKNREEKLGKSKPEPEEDVGKHTEPPPEEPDTEIDTTATETQSEVEKTFEDEGIKLEKRKQNQKKLGNIIAKRKQTINDLVEQRVNQKFKEMEEKRNQTKKVQIVEPPKQAPTPAPVVRPKVIRRTFKKYPWE